MSCYLRPRIPGACVFFSVWLAHRGTRLLLDEIDILREAVAVFQLDLTGPTLASSAPSEPAPASAQPIRTAAASAKPPTAKTNVSSPADNSDLEWQTF